jgi:hypothetical protein
MVVVAGDGLLHHFGILRSDHPKPASTAFRDRARDLGR